MRVLDADEPGALGAAVSALRAGLVVVVPTDTVYGIAADPFRPGANDRLFAAKDRPRHVQLPVLGWWAVATRCSARPERRAATPGRE